MESELCSIGDALGRHALLGLNYRKLQKLAKSLGIRANQSSAKLTAAIDAAQNPGKRRSGRKRAASSSHDGHTASRVSSRRRTASDKTRTLSSSDIGFEHVKQTLLNPDQWVCSDCESGLDPRVHLRDGRCYCLDHAVMAAQSRPRRSFFFVLNNGGEGYDVEVIQKGRSIAEVAIVSGEAVVGPLEQLRTILSELQDPATQRAARTFRRKRKRKQTKPRQSELFAMRESGFLSARARSRRKHEDLLAAAISRWRHSSMTRCFNTWKVYRNPDRAASPRSHQRGQSDDSLEENMEVLPLLRRQFSMGASSVLVSAIDYSQGRASTEKASRIPKLFPGRCGLRNLGNTCYMNSVVQALSNAPAMCDFYARVLYPRVADKCGKRSSSGGGSANKKDGRRDRQSANDRTGGRRRRGRRQRSRAKQPGLQLDKDNTDDNTDRNTPRKNLSECLSEIFAQIWSGKRVVFTADDLLDAVWDAAPQFRGFKQQDAQEFLMFLLNQLEEEYVKMHPNAAQRTKKTGLIRYYFGMKSGTRVMCERGHTTEGSISNYTISLCLGGAGAAVSATRKRSKRGQAPSKQPPLSLLNLLQSHLSTRWEMKGDNQYMCSKCKGKIPAVRTSHLQQLPSQCMIIHVARAQFDPVTCRFAKNARHVEFPLEGLDMTEYLEAKREISERFVYDLTAVVSHHGKGFKQGHFTAYGYNRKLKTWFHFNDRLVKPVSADEVARSQAYILVYERRREALKELGDHHTAQDLFDKLA